MRQLDSVPACLEVVEFDHVVADLKNGSAGFEFFFLALVPQVTDKLFGNAVEMHHGFQSQMVITFEDLHRLFLRFELSGHDQFSVLDHLVLLRSTPAFAVELAIEVVGVDQLSGFEQF